MYEILNNIGIPNELGFDIDAIVLRDLFNSKSSQKKFYDALNDEIEKIKNNYGIDESLQLRFKFILSILSYNGKKCIAINKRYIILSLYEYFDGIVPDNLLEHIHFNQTPEQEQEILDIEISKLKEFLRAKIKQLAGVKNLNDLSEVSTILYNSYLSAFNENPVDDYAWQIYFKQEIEKDVQKFKRLNLWLKEFIQDVSKPIDESLFLDMDKDKIKLYLAAQYLNLAIHLQEPLRSIIIDYAQRCANSITNDEVVLESIYVWDRYFLDDNTPKIRMIGLKNYTKKDFLGVLYGLLLKNTDLIENVNIFSSYSNEYFNVFDFYDITNFLMEKIEEGIKLSKQAGAKDVELETKLLDLEKKANSTNLSIAELRTIKRQIERLNMVLKEIKPDKVQEGGGKFKGFYVYYYETSGMVAIDKIDKSAGLYIMPINVYVSILENLKYQENTLYDIRKIAGVSFISHSRRNWLDDARKSIYSKQITEAEMKTFDEIKTIEFSYSLDKLNELEKQYKTNESVLQEIAKRKKSIIKQAKEIDEEIRSSITDLNISDDDQKDLLPVEEDILMASDKSLDFGSLYDLAVPKREKVKRNPAVSLFTKLRTRDELGRYHCDFCDEEYDKNTASYFLGRFESHHIIPIAEGGVDNVYNTACLCPACHNRFHNNPKPTFAERGRLLKRVKERIIKSTPEYLPYFEQLFNPNYHLDNNLSDEELEKKYQKEEEFYKQNKEQEDLNFLVDWNTPLKK